MYSSMGEYIQLTKLIETKNAENNEVRNVEDWLGEVEIQMRDSLRDLVKSSAKAYSIENRK